MFCWFMAQKSLFTLQAIGRKINRDHATVIHAVKTVNNMIATDKNYKNQIEQIKDRL